MTVELFKDDRAANYDHFVNTWIPGYEAFIQLAENVINLKTKANKNPRLLIAGCGSGAEMLHMAQNHDHWQLTGIDPSPEMIDQATAKLADHQNIRLINGLVSDLATGNYFDGATLILVLHFMPNDGTKLALLKDISSRLKPNAPFYLVDIFGEGSTFDLNLALLGELLKEQVDSDALTVRLQRIREKIHHISEGKLCVLLEKAGFEQPTRLYQSTIYGSWYTHKTV